MQHSASDFLCLVFFRSRCFSEGCLSGSHVHIRQIIIINCSIVEAASVILISAGLNVAEILRGIGTRS